MADSKQLQILKAMTTMLETVTLPDGSSFTGKVFRGRVMFSDSDPYPSMALLETPRPEAIQWADETSTVRHEGWHLILQGWVEDDFDNPTDPAYVAKAAAEQCLSAIIALDTTGLPVYPSAFMLGGLITGFEIGQGVCRPPEGQLSSKAYFYIPLVVRLAFDVSDPYAT